MSDPTKVVGDAGAITVTLDTTKVARVFTAVPKVGYFWMRDYFGRILGQHRKAWLAQKGTKFGRGADGVKVYQVNQGPAAPSPKDVAYRVSPSQQRAANPSQAIEFLNRLTAEAFTGGIVLPVHQFGQDIRSSTYMSIAVKTRPAAPKRWRAKYPNRRLITLPSKRHDGKLLVYEVETVGRRGRTKKGQQRETRTRLRLRWLLTKYVDMKPTLHMYESWDGLRAQRDVEWSQVASAMLRDLENPNPRDL